MIIKEPSEAKEIIRKWLTDSEHSIEELKDENANFSIEIDYPVGQQLKQLITQPKKVRDLVLIIHSIVISPEHLTGLHKMKPRARDSLMYELRREFMFKENQFELKFNPDGLLSSIVFTYPIFFDGLSKNNLYKALDTNFRCYLYLSLELSEKVGGGPFSSDSDISRMYV